MIFIILIFLAGFLIRIYPLLSNNFYFTMDQGNDAVHVREILVRHQILLKGPETGIEGIFAQPLWYYFLSVGYVISGGHPAGAVILLILLNLTTLFLLFNFLRQRLKSPFPYIIAFVLIFSWVFYHPSRYAYNPFPLVSLSVLMVIFLIKTFEENSKYFVWGSVFAGLFFHAEVAGAVVLSIFYFLIGIFYLFVKKIHLKHYFFSIFIFALFSTPLLLSEFQENFSQTRVLIRQLQDPSGVFAGTKIETVNTGFLEIIQEAVIPQNLTLTFLFLISIFIIYMISFRQMQSKSALFFSTLTLFLFSLSYVFFLTNSGWYDWQTVYLSPLILISLVILISSPPGRFKLNYILLAILAFSQLLYFSNRYLDSLMSTDDASLLKNELEAIDWIYTESENKSPYVYSYLPSVYDYPYQYLIWWYGRKNYGYLPCEYASFPKSPGIFIPGKRYYQDPKRECSNLRFLIIEPDKNKHVQEEWLRSTREATELVKDFKIGDLTVEKRVF